MHGVLCRSGARRPHPTYRAHPLHAHFRANAYAHHRRLEEHMGWYLNEFGLVMRFSGTLIGWNLGATQGALPSVLQGSSQSLVGYHSESNRNLTGSSRTYMHTNRRTSGHHWPAARHQPLTKQPAFMCTLIMLSRTCRFHNQQSW